MIRALKVKCNQDFKYCKKVFKSDEIYKAYIGKTGYLVINERARIYFNDRRPGMLRFETDSMRFKDNFEIIEEHLVKNKEELSQFISTNEDN